jgi:protease I
MEPVGKKIARRAADLCHDLQVWHPICRLREAGAAVLVVGTRWKCVCPSKSGEIRSDTATATISPGQFGGVIIPGNFGVGPS